MLELVIWYLAGLLIWAVFTVLIYKSVCLRTQKKWPRRLALAIMILLPTWDVALALALYKPACWTWAKMEYYGDCGPLEGEGCGNLNSVSARSSPVGDCPYIVGRWQISGKGFSFLKIEYFDTRCRKTVGVTRDYFVEKYIATGFIPFFSWVLESQDRPVWLWCPGEKVWTEFERKLLKKNSGGDE